MTAQGLISTSKKYDASKVNVPQDMVVTSSTSNVMEYLHKFKNKLEDTNNNTNNVVDVVYRFFIRFWRKLHLCVWQKYHQYCIPRLKSKKSSNMMSKWRTFVTCKLNTVRPIHYFHYSFIHLFSYSMFSWIQRLFTVMYCSYL